MNKYDDIINLPHYEPKNHKRMSLEARAAQFAPFAALTGYEDEIKETARLTDKRINITESQKTLLNSKIQYLLKRIELKPKITFTFFVKDKKKTGGKYIEKTGIIKKIDKINKYIILTDNTKIPISEIINVNSELFKDIEIY